MKIQVAIVATVRRIAESVTDYGIRCDVTRLSIPPTMAAVKKGSASGTERSREIGEAIVRRPGLCSVTPVRTHADQPNLN